MPSARSLFLLALPLAVASCTNYERLANDELTGEGFVNVELKATGKGSFDFTGSKADGVPCNGTIAITKGIGSSSKVESHQCERTCSAKTPDVCLDQGEAHEKAAEFDKARESYGQGCDNGSGPSCDNLAMLYVQGQGGPRDETKQAAFFARACELGDAVGCKNTGITLSKAAPPRLELAFASFKKSCDLGANDGCYELARSYMDGHGVAADPVAGFAGFDKACKAGVQHACSALGLYLVLGKGAPLDVPRGAKLLGDACAKDDGEACKNLGILVREGKVPPKDPKRFFALFDKACTLKDAAGCNELGLAFERAQGTARDQKRANELYQQSCDLGAAMACMNLGLDLRDGLGIARDAKRAAEMFDTACAGGQIRACDLRKKLH